MRLNKAVGFTLVELIVVITILAILGTIGFISFQGYATSARDSARVSDIGIIAKGIDLFKIREGFYPAPTDSYDVTFSGSIAWKQGVFGDSTRQLTRRISEVPVDPLTGSRYSYSVTNTGQEYELGAITEGLISGNINSQEILVSTNNVFADNSFFTYIKGNYNKQIVTVKEPTKLYILGVPTIITTEIESVDVRDILTRQSFAISGSKNLPGSYALSLPEGQTSTGSVSFTSGMVATAPVLFEGTTQELSGSNSKQILGENLVSYYANSNLSTESSYSNLGSIRTGQEYEYINTLIQADTSGLGSSNVVVSTQVPTNVGSTGGGGAGGSDPAPATCMDMTQNQLDNLNNWMSVTLSDGFYGSVDSYAVLEIGVSSLTVEQWCNLTIIESYGDPSGVQMTYIPEEVGYLENLTFLIFSDHNLQEIPESLTFLSQLQDVNLDGNQLGNLGLGRFDWVDGYTCENNISDKGNGMCLELVSSGGGEFGDGGEESGGGWGGDNVRFVLKGSQHFICEEDMTDTQLAGLNNWGTVELRNSGNSIEIYQQGNSNLTKSQWCSIEQISGSFRDVPEPDPGIITYLPSELYLLPRLNTIGFFQNKDISTLSDQFHLISKLQSLDLSGNPQLGNLNNVFNLNSPQVCDNISNGTAPRSVCIGGGESSLEITDANS